MRPSTSGARSRNSNKEIFLKLLRSPKSFQVVAVCGRNDPLKEELEAISAPGNHPVKIFGFVDNMHLLMSAADVLVGKTGGPTMAEAVVKKLPIIITDAKPGHELINLNYLLAHGVIDFARIPREAVFLVEQVLDGRIRRNWQQAYELVVRPNKAEEIVSAINRIKPKIQASNPKVRNYQEN